MKWFLTGVGSQLRAVRRNEDNDLREGKNPHCRKSSLRSKLLQLVSSRTSVVRTLVLKDVGVQGKVRKREEQGGGLVCENKKTTISSSESLKCPSPFALNPGRREL